MNSRESFEKWLLDVTPDMDVKKTQGEYDHYFTDSMWQAWQAAQPQWQPIEIAPTDQWLLFLDGNETRMESSLGQKHHVDLIKPDRSGETVYAYKHNYTHWIPLPETPTKEI